jgi:hypothetical protein
LPTHNCFDVLFIQESNETIETVDKVVQDSEPLPFPIPTSLLCPNFCLKWERKLPFKFIITATEGQANSLKLKVKSANTLIDCGAIREFIDHHCAKSSQFQLLKLSEPIPIFNIDGTPNKDGAVMEVVGLILPYKSHSEHALFAVSNLRKQKLILRHSWLYKHNLENLTGKLEKSRCLGVPLGAVLAVERMANKSKLLI